MRVEDADDRLLLTYFIESLSEQILTASYGGAQPNISPKKLASFQLAWPNKDKRREIGRNIRSAIEWIDHLASETTSARKLIDHLDQAVLAKAFRGELVPQDPNDEPASVLLERIRSERAASPTKPRRRRSRTKATV